jgi:hypothetical protein
MQQNPTMDEVDQDLAPDAIKKESIKLLLHA